MSFGVWQQPPQPATAPWGGFEASQGSYGCDWSQGSSPNSLEDEVVAAFMGQLDIRPCEQSTFGWIAELGLQSPLPPSWSSCVDPSTGYTYFVNCDTQATTWENPLVPALRYVVDVGRLFLQQGSAQETFLEDQRGRLWQETTAMLEGWHGPFTDFAGRPYYVNSVTQEASPNDPRAEAQYIYELQDSFLVTLAETLCPEPERPGTPGGNWDDAANEREPLTARLNRMKADGFLADQKSALKHMSWAYDFLLEVFADESEAQQLKITQKIAARKKRQLCASSVPKPPRSLPPLDTAPPPGDAVDASRPSPMGGGRRAPRPLALGSEDEDGQAGDALGPLPALEKAPPPRPQGVPSPANKRPPPAAKRGGKLPPPPPVPMSPALRQRRPSKEFVAEAFLASAVQKRQQPQPHPEPARQEDAPAACAGKLPAEDFIRKRLAPLGGDDDPDLEDATLS